MAPPVVPLITPLLAPLSYSLMRHWAREAESALSAPLVRVLKTALEDDDTRHASLWAGLEQTVRAKSEAAFTLINPQLPEFPARPKVKTGWLVEELSALAPIPFTRDTLNRWVAKGVVRQLGHGLVEPQCAAELVTARQMVAKTREREWMDTERGEEEPYFYVWVQVEPGAPVFPLPYPLPATLPPDAVVWSPWQGVAWDQQWVGIEGLGAIRFAGATVRRGRRHWLLSAKQLRKWDPDMLPVDPGIFERSDDAFDGAATLTLARLAVTRLASSLPPQANLLPSL